MLTKTNALPPNQAATFGMNVLNMASNSECGYRQKTDYCFLSIWHPSLTKKLSKNIEWVQKRLKLLYPSISYSDALCMSSLDRLDDRRDMITQKVFREIKDPKHPLHNILPPIKVSHSQITLRPTYPYQIPFCNKKAVLSQR